MAVYFYAENDLSSDFVGFRCVKNTQSGDLYKQKYYSLNDYSYTKARKLAYEQEAEWTMERQLELAEKSTSIVRWRKGTSKRYWIATNLVFAVVNDKKRGNDCWGVKFIVYLGHGKGQKGVALKGDYKAAYAEALDTYCEVYGLGKEERIPFEEIIPMYGELMNYVCDEAPLHYPDMPTDLVVKKLQNSRKDKV